MATAGALKGSESEGKLTTTFGFMGYVALKLAPLKTTHFGLDMGFPSHLEPAAFWMEQFTESVF